MIETLKTAALFALVFGLACGLIAREIDRAPKLRDEPGLVILLESGRAWPPF